MSWNRPKRTMSKVYEWIWDHVEPIKSLLLTFLILFSILLTWKLWTYTPNFEKLDETDPIIANIEVGSKVPLARVIQPSKVLLHHDGKHYWVPTITSERGNIYEQLQNNVLLVKDNRTANKIETYPNKFEIDYPTAIPMPVLKNIFQFSNDHPFSADLGSVKSILVYGKNKEWFVRFKTENSDVDHYNFQITEAGSFAKTMENYLNNEDRIELETYSFNGTDFYLPEKTIIKSYLYQIEETDMDDYLNFLLPGDIVKVDSLENRVTYSDGKSIIQYFKAQHRFSFTSPSSRSSTETKVSQPGIAKGVDFINSHTGWTDVFHLYDFTSIDQDYEGTNDHDEMLFRMILGGIPVMDTPLSAIRLEYTNQELYKYERSLFYLPKHAFKDEVELKSGADVIKELEKLGSTKVKDIMIGYRVIKNDDKTSFIFEPGWYYKVGNKWKPVEDIQPPLENKGG